MNETEERQKQQLLEEKHAQKEQAKRTKAAQQALYRSLLKPQLWGEEVKQKAKPFPQAPVYFGG